MRHKLYYQAIARFEKLGPIRLRSLLEFMGNIENIWNAPPYQLKQSGLDEKIVDEFVNWKSDQNIEQQWNNLQVQGIKVLTWEDEEYPSCLKEIHDPPHTLFVRGNIPENDDFKIAVVGTRRMSSYGRQVIENIVRPLARSGITIVSGLALGVDAFAHDVTIKEEGNALAVLGGGCDTNTIYPSSNRYLAESIINKGGAIISEYAPETLSMPYYFPRRNRIISGLSKGVLIIEATEHSGSLITARCALDQNREVFTVPADITRETSKGTNNLLKLGAHVILEASDLFQLLNLQLPQEKSIIPDNEIEEQIMQNITNEPIHIDKLAQKTQITVDELSSNLTLMAMKGKLRHIGGMNYILNK